LSEFARKKWNKRYDSDDVRTEPSPFLTDMLQFVPRRGRALDIAGGAGRNAIVLARRGLTTTVVDISDVGLARCAEAGKQAGVRLRTVCLDLDEKPLPKGPWDVVLVFHYLNRLLFSSIEERLAPGGVLITSIATVRNRERNERPPLEHCLDEGELPSLIGDLGVIHYEETWRDDRHEARLVARR
jgi:SAM-dependent methyltransferase